ncbi:MFS transporter, partial [Streptomyces hydrogenans]
VVLAAALVAAAVPVALALPAARPPAVGDPGSGGPWAVFRRRPLLLATVTSVGCTAAQGMAAACVPALGARALGAPGRGALLLTVAAAAPHPPTPLHARLGRAVPPGRGLGFGALVKASLLKK